jgi:prophage regulatory protein
MKTLPVDPSTDRLIRLRELCPLVSMSRTTIWRKVKAGSFPSPRRLSANVIAWRLDEVNQWMQQLPQTVLGERR